MGTTVTKDGVEITLSDAYFTPQVGSNAPQGGYKFLVVEAQIKNVGRDNLPYNPSSFSGIDMRTNAGYDAEWLYGTGSLGDGRLEPGEYSRGSFALEVQETAERVVIVFDPNQFITDDDLFWIFE